MASLVHLILSLLGLSISQGPIPTTDLPSTAEITCPVNETVVDCVVPCNDCEVRGRCQFWKCRKGCDCKEGYFRNDDFKCILDDDCFPDDDSDEVPDSRMGGCTDTRCDTFCKGYGRRGFCKEAYPRGEKICLCEANRCTLYIEGSGSVNCTENVRRTVCDIECGGNFEGTFICTPEKGWTEKLPGCAREVKKDKDGSESAEQVAESGGCPDEAKCSELCRQKGRKDGKCFGPNRITCTCRVG